MSFLHWVPCPLLHIRVWRHVDNMQASAIDKLPISANRFSWTSAWISMGDLHTKGFGTANPLIPALDIYNGQWICIIVYINETAVFLRIGP